MLVCDMVIVASKYRMIAVSILVLVDVGLRPGQERWPMPRALTVSILVLVDVGLRLS